VFGGWSLDWLADLWCLPVGNITGPPYAISHVKPKLGPLTGKTKITISGKGFRDDKITVKFSTPKGMLEVPGQYMDENTLTCETPSFEQYGPRTAEVKVAIGRQDFTLGFLKFAYFLNTKADKTIAYGPGLLQDNAVGQESTFCIQSRNADGINRESGSD
jgi:dynein heavy chain